jgi:hypothetical protein
LRVSLAEKPASRGCVTEPNGDVNGPGDSKNVEHARYGLPQLA